MYCEECGHEFKNYNSAYCTECGCKRGNGNNFCNVCGTKKIYSNQDACLSCRQNFKILKHISIKNKIAYLLFLFFLGTFGGHQFYLGHKSQGIKYVLLGIFAPITFGITGLIVLVLMILDVIALLKNNVKDSEGRFVTEWT